MIFILQKMNARFSKDLLCLRRPEGGLDLTDVSLAEEEHADSGLTDASSDREGELVVQDGFLEGKLCAVFTAGFFELFGKRLGIDTDAHG